MNDDSGSGKDSIALYKELLEISDDLREYTENLGTHDTFLDFDELNREMFQLIQELDEPISKEKIFDEIEDLEYRYKSSFSFYMSPRNDSDKLKDVQLGKKFEETFMQFLRNKGFNCERGDDENTKYPDILVQSQNGDKIAYIEFKYLHAPFLTVGKKVDGREWYEGSTTLDFEKAEKQLELIRNEIEIPVYYTYWIDFPAVKGIFSMRANDVSKLIEEGTEYDREEREGDYTVVQESEKKWGYTKKIYLPLLQMNNFEELMKDLNEKSREIT